jgi:tetrahydromethanopterin S-methyltransferase subunit G
MAEHYQKTMDLVTRVWERRNRQFIILVAVLAAAVLVAFARQLIAPALETVIFAHLPGLNSAAAERLRAFLPLASDLLLALLLVTVFYLMASLAHGTGWIINSYLYMSMLEREIRQQLKISRDQIAFTREGPFYEVTGSKLTRVIGLCYKSVLGLLLLSFFTSRIFFDLPSDWVPLRVPGREDAVRWYGWLIGNFLFVFDILIAIPTLWLFARYAGLISSQSEADVRREISRLVDQV